MSNIAWWWPTPKRFLEVSAIEAGSHTGAVTHAVHQKMRILRRNHFDPIATPNAEVVDEGAILERVLEDVSHEGVQLTLIEGKSGTGKSHIVYWLQLQLESRADKATRVVLAVGKGSRLRSIVASLLAILEGAEYEHLKRRLATAQEAIEPDVAAGRLCEELAQVCLARHAAATAKRARLEPLNDLEKLYAKWGGERDLPHILVYQPLRVALAGSDGPLRRLVSNLAGMAEGGEAVAPEFFPDDLRFDHLPDELDQRAMTVLGQLGQVAKRREAAQVLNDALDSAKMVLVGIDPGVVSSVLKAIREALFAEGRELLLLVEDFADLSGLQGEILQAAIQSKADTLRGIAKYCTLRTVLAYTDNRVHESTALSRARYVYYVPSAFDEAGTLDRTVELVGAYLRAARHGGEALERARGESVGENWIPSDPDLSEADRAILESFGATQSGVPLFPFNRRLIRRFLADHYSGAGNQGGDVFPFVPRDIVTGIMRRLLQHRDEFLGGTFPSNSFRHSQLALLSAEEFEWINLHNHQPEMRARLIRFVAYWGLSSSSMAGAFGLFEPPPGVFGQEARKRPPGRVQVAAVPESAAGPEAVPTFGDAEQVIVDQWRRNQPLGGNNNGNRAAVGRALEVALAWEWFARKTPVMGARWRSWHEGIDIAGIPRHARPTMTFELVTEDDRVDPARNERIGRELTSLLGAVSADSWDIYGVESFLAAHMSFVERHRDSVRSTLLSFWHLREWDALPYLVNSIRYANAALGVEGTQGGDIDSAAAALFKQSPVVQTPPDSEWQRETLPKITSLRNELINALKEEVGFFQGTGSMLHGVDICRLETVLKSDPASDFPYPISLPDFQHGGNSAAAIAVRKSRDDFRDAVRVANGELSRRRDLGTAICLALGEETKDVLATAIRQFTEAASEAGVITQNDGIELDRVANELHRLPVKRSLDAAAVLSRPANTNLQRLRALGQTAEEAPALAVVAGVLASAKRIMDGAAQRLSDVVDANPLEEARAAHEGRLTMANTILRTAGGAQ